MTAPTLDTVVARETVADDWGAWEQAVTVRDRLKAELWDELRAWPAPALVGRGLDYAAAVRLATGAPWLAVGTVAEILLESRTWFDAGTRLRGWLVGISAGQAEYAARAWVLAEGLAPAVCARPHDVYHLLRPHREGG